ncbi:TIGR02679 family protein [Natronoglycomyces albus]|uniref:TIGR02679 family protein n=1 Tax=Natronoglycomyces albus TaxID=2811108 RepID=A0A895XNM5_9ACTN|nr:TIGR02679 family protein [Natronoglycomyces albus]QSB05143.1 TIGR02679 family protein [Natronoglycomyces albus]
MSVDVDRLRRTLGADELAWLVDRLVRRLELGHELSGTVTQNVATTQERRAAAKLLGRPDRGGQGVSVRLEALEARLRGSGIAPDLRSAIETLRGPVVSRLETQSEENQERERLGEVRNASKHRGENWYEAWSSAIESDGTVTKRIREGKAETIAQAVAVLDRLPAADLPVPVLAEAATGDTKALSNTGLERLVLRAIAGWRGRAVPADRSQMRSLWAEVGVVVDDLSSQVLVLGVRVREPHVIGQWLDAAAQDGLPFRLTLQQLMRYPSTPAFPELYVCENPAVMRVAAEELGSKCPPLICTEGEAFHACTRFIATAANAGVRIHWRGDFDWTGVRSTAAAIQRWRAVPWRMGNSDYLEALERGEAEALKGRPTQSPWDPKLAVEMQHHQYAVMEERLLPRLLDDLHIAKNVN